MTSPARRPLSPPQEAVQEVSTQMSKWHGISRDILRYPEISCNIPFHVYSTVRSVQSYEWPCYSILYSVDIPHVHAHAVYVVTAHGKLCVHVWPVACVLWIGLIMTSMLY